MEKQPHPYEDILHLPHHVSANRPHMSMHDRAAQFSPFAALVGYEEIIDETARQTTPERELDEAKKAELDRRIAALLAHLREKPVVTIEYFVADERKSGGAYLVKNGAVVKISSARKNLTLADGTVIPIQDITDITGAPVEEMEL